MEWAHVLAPRLYSRIYSQPAALCCIPFFQHPQTSVNVHRLPVRGRCHSKLYTAMCSFPARKLRSSRFQDEGASHLYSEAQPCQRLYALQIVIQKRKQAPKRNVSILKRKRCLKSTAVPDFMINATNKQLEGCLCWTCSVCCCLCCFLIQQIQIIQGKHAQLCFFASLANPEKATICRFQKSKNDAEVSLLPKIFSQSTIVVPTKSKIDANSMIVRRPELEIA